MLSRKGGEKRRERTGDLTVPDARRNDEDRASTHEDVNGFIVGQEDHLDLAVENVEKLVAVRMELPRPLRCESPDGDSAFVESRELRASGPERFVCRTRGDLRLAAQRGADVLGLHHTFNLPLCRVPLRPNDKSAASLTPFTALGKQSIRYGGRRIDSILEVAEKTPVSGNPSQPVSRR